MTMTKEDVRKVIEIHKSYKEVRDAAYEAAKQMMKEQGGSYTARAIAEMTGLTPNIIIALVRERSGMCRTYKTKTRTYCEVDENGIIKPNGDKLTITSQQTEYYV